jgi:catechol 2,3-dioxygenase-like lactoylglutathione lyase family enzyme
MDPRVNFITFATRDLDAARAFYRDGFGWEPLVDVPGEIVFFQVGPGLVLGLYDSLTFNDDLGRQVHDISISGVTLSQNVDSPAAVDALVASAVGAGAAVLKVPQVAAFGGYHGHFVDPNGVIWEIAHNPGWSVDPSGAVTLQ